MRYYCSALLYQADWFIDLELKHKVLWGFINAHANAAGIWTPNFKAASLLLGVRIMDRDLTAFGNKIRRLKSGNILIEGFATEQFGKVTSTHGIHKTILNIISTEGLTINDLQEIPTDTLSHTTGGGSNTPREGEGEGEGEQGECEGDARSGGNGHGWQPSDIQKRINSWFGRRDSTKWSDKELRAFKAIGEINPDDLADLERYYTRSWPKDKDYRRRDLATLLNNWPGDCDKARRDKVLILEGNGNRGF